MNPLFAEARTTVFETMSGLARRHEAVNLGQGFPDDPGPEDVRRLAADAVLDGWNQYPPMMGLPELRESVAAHYRRFQGLELNPEREVLITSGATEALAASIFSLIEPGDEVVLFQPLYDAYLPLVLRAGGVPRYVTLAPPDWRFDEAALEAAFSPRTRLVVLNNPLNPAGAVVPEEDLRLLAKHVLDHDALVVCDEVWEHVVFDGLRHRPLLGLPEMRERAIKIGSAGKIFSLTGWKVGFVCATPKVLSAVAKAHQFLTFTTPPNLQTAVAYGLGKPDDYFADLRQGLERKRDRFAGGLEEAGFAVLPSRGTYFLNIDLKPLGVNELDEDFCMKLVQEAGVAAIPVSAFYAQDPVESVVRFCFAKRDEVLDDAIERIARFSGL